MGVPVITMAGATHVSRVTASLLTHLGRPEWIANSEDEYLALGTSLAANSVHLAAERSAQRERMRTSPLCDAEGFTLGLESAYRAAWRDWAERPAN
jgi:predicted O-linked N-acetylglucosamine transferase (SPINDLY family)